MAGRKSPNGLAGEDRQLWKRVTASTEPLSQQARNSSADMASLLDMAEVKPHKLPPVFKNHKNRPLPPSTPTDTPVKPEQKRAPQTPISNPIEKPILKKLAKGRLAIDARIDLHGMTQDRARSALLDFLQLAYAADHRIVLIITGKGNAGMGILRQRVPDWLHLPPFSNFVNGVRESHISHGGEGALYVRIRRNRDQRGARSR